MNKPQTTQLCPYCHCPCRVKARELELEIERHRQAIISLEHSRADLETAERIIVEFSDAR